MTRLGFGELELFILKIVRKLGRVTVREVYEQLGSKGSYTTIMTVMSRMSDKGVLTREKEGKQYIYWMGTQHESISKQVFKRIQERIFGGRPIAWVNYLLTEASLSDEELKEMEHLIQKRREENKRG